MMIIAVVIKVGRFLMPKLAVWLVFLAILHDAVAFQPADKAALVTAVDLWCSDEASALATYGDISTWDTSLVTDMSYLFDGSSCNPDIGGWDTSSVTIMKRMFRNAYSFDQNLCWAVPEPLKKNLLKQEIGM